MTVRRAARVSLEDCLLPVAATLLLWAAQWVVFAVRPPLPVDETRYLTVAWEMWLSGDWLVPHLDGQPYSDKPPLLFWLINLAWSVAGPGAAAARFVTFSAGVATAVLSGLIAKQLWPDLRGAGPWSLLVVSATGVVSLFFGLVMFDGLLTVGVLLSVLGMLLVWRRRQAAWWALVAVGLGLGVLAKGPVALLHVLAVGGPAAFWIAADAPGGRQSWYLGLLAAIGGGALLALAWAVPAALAGGAAYREMILWGQTAGRIEHAFAHARSWWYYLALLPVVVFPWGWWPALWRRARPGGWREGDPGLRLCAIWFLGLLVILSAISGKQIHYLLPTLPALALIAVHRLLRHDGGPRRYDLVLPLLPMLGVGLLAPLFELVDAAGLAAQLPAALDRIAALRVDWPAWGLLAILAAVLLATPRRAKPQALALATGWAATLVALHLVAAPILATYDWSRVAPSVRAHQACGVAWVGDYAGEIGFMARLTRPVETIIEPEVAAWLAAHPGGIVLDKRFTAEKAAMLPAPDRELPYRSKRLALWIAPGATAECR